MKYKVGDKVRIKSIDWYNENKSKSHGTVVCGGKYFYYDMIEWCGKTLTIQTIGLDFYLMEEDNLGYEFTDKMIEGLVEDETKPKDMGEVSDGYHTFNELAKQGLYDVHKSRKHSDGEYPFGDQNWFIVMAELPTGQISNHYEMKDWDLFDIPEKETANIWDGHTPKDVAERIRKFLTPKQKYPKTYEECLKILNTDDDDCICISVPLHYNHLLISFTQLLICRDAYWKIAGEEMGLGKPWEPYWSNDNQFKYIITCCRDNVNKDTYTARNCTLAFPTKEMRDAFYENFKKEIEICKELL